MSVLNTKPAFAPRAALLCILACLCFAAGCGLRPAEVPAAPADAASASPAPTDAPEYTVRFVAEGETLSEQSVAAGTAPALPEYAGPLRLAGWTDGTGALVSPADRPAASDAVYTAVLYPPLLENTPFLAADADGLLRPEGLWTRADAAAALYALLPEKPAGDAVLTDMDEADPRFAACAALTSAGYFETSPGAAEGEALFRPGDACTAEEWDALLARFFSEAERAALPAPADPDAGTLTRAQAAAGLTALLGTAPDPGDKYLPDVSSARADHDMLLTAAADGGLRPEDLAARAQDGFLWFSGYLYAWDAESGYFVTDATLDTLHFDKNGRYTCGSAELDAYVAATIAARTDDSMTRLDKLRAMHNYVRDGFQYLRRNYYDAGAVGWENDEALLLFSTGKGNCYSYAGAFCSLARGLGYHAVVYSGTISKNYDVHGWTEILLDGVTYICDPEIQMEYWRDGHIYDTFMLTYDKAVGWQYEAPGRTD